MNEMKPYNKLNRREILERITLVMGGTLSLSLVAACDAGVSVPNKGTNLKALTKSQLNLVADIADKIIPTTGTPGAKAVNVHYLIDELVANWMSDEARIRFLCDLNILDNRIKNQWGNNFSELLSSDQDTVLDQLGAEMVNSDDKHVYQDIREMTLYGYYTSEIGATEELIYDPIPGGFKGCIPLSDIGKSWAT